MPETLAEELERIQRNRNQAWRMERHGFRVAFPKVVLAKDSSSAG